MQIFIKAVRAFYTQNLKLASLRHPKLGYAIFISLIYQSYFFDSITYSLFSCFGILSKFAHSLVVQDNCHSDNQTSFCNCPRPCNIKHFTYNLLTKVTYPYNSFFLIFNMPACCLLVTTGPKSFIV